MTGRRPYVAETAVSPGCGVVQGAADNGAAAPADGAGDFLGVYPFEANAAAAAGDHVGVVLSGVCKALLGGTAHAGKAAALAAGGAFVEASAAEGLHATCGTFLESGEAGEYVDLMVARGSVTVPAE